MVSTFRIVLFLIKVKFGKSEIADIGVLNGVQVEVWYTLHRSK